MSIPTVAPEVKLRNAILERYRSVRAFCNAHNLPYSTIDNVFKRGVDSVSISTATQLCTALNLDLAAFGKGQIAPLREDAQSYPEETQLLENYRQLDSSGKELVELVAEKERERCDRGRALQPAFGAKGWQQYLGVPIACRGGGVIAATEEDARQMERIYKNLLSGKEKGGKVP